MNILRKWREARGITSTEAAKLVGVTQAQWSRYETEKNGVGAKRVALVSAVTGIPCHALRPDIFGQVEAAE